MKGGRVFRPGADPVHVRVVGARGRGTDGGARTRCSARQRFGRPPQHGLRGQVGVGRGGGVKIPILL